MSFRECELHITVDGNKFVAAVPEYEGWVRLLEVPSSKNISGALLGRRAREASREYQISCTAAAQNGIGRWRRSKCCPGLTSATTQSYNLSSGPVL